jgi:dCMP deaminase
VDEGYSMNKKTMSDNYWMKICDDIAEASTCRVKIACLLVKRKKIVGVGYLGSVSGDYHCDIHGCLFVPNYGVQGMGDGDERCIRTIHAEQNAILQCVNYGEPGNWLTCYSTYEPCLICFKLLLAVGTRTFVFRKEYKDDLRDLYIDKLDISIKSRLSKIHINEY